MPSLSLSLTPSKLVASAAMYTRLLLEGRDLPHCGSEVGGMYMEDSDIGELRPAELTQQS